MGQRTNTTVRLKQIAKTAYHPTQLASAVAGFCKRNTA